MAGQSENSARAIGIAIIAHALVIAALTFSLPLQTPQRGPVVVPIEAVLDMDSLARERQRLEAETAERVRQEQEAREAEQRRQEQIAQQQREEEERALQQRQAEAERQRELEAEAERQRQADLQRQREVEAAEAERQRQAELERQREAEAERQRQAELQRQREAEAEAERQRQAALAREQQLQREQAEREADLERLLAAEERTRLARESGAEDEYRRSIQNKIQQHWIRPASAGSGIECVVTVEQIRSGDVTNVVVGRCNGDEAVVSSIERAVLAASPLPRPPVPEVFQRTLVITFRPDDAF